MWVVVGVPRTAAPLDSCLRRNDELGAGGVGGARRSVGGGAPRGRPSGFPRFRGGGLCLRRNDAGGVGMGRKTGKGNVRGGSIGACRGSCLRRNDVGWGGVAGRELPHPNLPPEGEGIVAPLGGGMEG